MKGSPGAIFWRAIERDNVLIAETVAREFPTLPLDFALALVHLYGRKQANAMTRPRSATSSGTCLRRTRPLRSVTAGCHPGSAAQSTRLVVNGLRDV